jgi:hypothetical protein
LQRCLITVDKICSLVIWPPVWCSLYIQILHRLCQATGVNEEPLKTFVDKGELVFQRG